MDANCRPIGAALVACGQGLYVYRAGQTRRALEGHFYGLTRRDGRWFVSQRLDRDHGRLLSFRLVEDAVRDLRVEVRGLSGGVHQIDFIGDRLLVVDAYRNEVLDLRARRWLGWRKQSHFPRGRLPAGRGSANYAHFNSIFRSGDRLYLLAHNESWKTGRPSQLIAFSWPELGELEVIENVGMCAHNVLRRDGYFLVCDSLNGRLVNHGQPVFEPGKYSRGLAMNAGAILVGGSDYGERAERLSSTGYVYRLDRNFRLLETTCIEAAGQVHEIRFLETDYGLSNTHLA